MSKNNGMALVMIAEDDYNELRAERDALRERCADLELRLDAYNGNMMDVLIAERDALAAMLRLT